LELRIKESYSEVLARHAGPESYADDGNIVGVATAGVHAGPVLSSVNSFIPCADGVQAVEGKIVACVQRQVRDGHGGVEDLAHVWKLQAREPGEPMGSLALCQGRLVNLTESTTNMYADGQSDDFILLSTRANKTATAVAESAREGSHRREVSSNCYRCPGL
jgi:hypothetical protein